MDPSAPPGYWNHTQATAYCNMSNPGVVCPIDVRETGIFKTTARVNGVEHSDDVTLYCSESEPLLNNDLVRQQMMADLDSSNAASSDYTQRSERYFLVLQDTVAPGATPYLKIYPHLPSDDVCFDSTFIPYPANLPANTKIVAHGHDHPSEPNISVMCKDSTGASTIPATTVYGADQGDRDWADRVNTLYPTMPGYIIDKHNVYVLRPGQSLGHDHDPGNQFNWDGLSKTPNDATRFLRRCGWPKRIVP